MFWIHCVSGETVSGGAKGFPSHSLEQLHWKSWLSTESGKLSISRVEEHRPKTSVRKMKKWMSNDECILVVECTS
jgi:hypothetical protein